MAVTSQTDSEVVKPAMTPPTQANVNAAPQAAPIQPGPAQMTPGPASDAKPSLLAQMQAPGADLQGIMAKTAGATMGTGGQRAFDQGMTQPTPTIAPASPAPAPAAPSIAPATQSFGPGNDLRGTQINPATDPRLATTQGQVNGAADKLANGPDRFQMAQDRFKNFAEQTQPEFEAGLRSATQKAAANGAIGSGMLQTDYGNLADKRDLNLRGERSSLFNDALEGTIGDTRANVGLLSGLEGQQYGEGANDRSELRGERGYQNGMENQAYERGRDAIDQEDRLTNSAFGRGLATSQFGASGNPGATQLGLSGMYGQQASDAGNSLGQMVSQNASNGLLSSIYGQPKPQNGGSTPAVSPDNSLMSSIYGN